MEPIKGKLTNTVSSEELKFAINPSEYSLSQGFSFQAEACVGQPAPLISFRSGEGATLSFKLIFDRDTDKDAEPQKLIKFVRAINKVDETSRSVPEICFSYGEFSFTGFVTKYSLSVQRFDQKGAPTSVIADIALISSGAYESV